MAEEHTVCKSVFKNGDKPSAERLAQKWAELINSREGEVRPAHVRMMGTGPRGEAKP